MPENKKEKISIQEEIERRILHGLACEWENSLWVLDPIYQRKMKKPMFSLRNMTSRYGFWDGQRREICISRGLALDYTWNDVRDVLLHETAHQLAEEVLNAGQETSHGNVFRRACRMLRANPEASGRYKPLTERVCEQTAGEEDKIMLRVKKLLALSESGNHYEAEAAMAKAYHYIKKYNIDLLSFNEKRDFISIFAGKPALRHFREVYHLGNLLNDYYFVTVIWVSAYVVEKEKMGSVMELSGTKKNVEIASYVYEFVNHYIDSKWAEFNRDGKLNRYRKTDFATGIIEGFRTKFKKREIEEKETSNGREVLKIEDPMLVQYIDSRYPHVASMSRAVPDQDEKVLKEGRKFGREMVISKGITQTGKQTGLMIEE